MWLYYHVYRPLLMPSKNMCVFKLGLKKALLVLVSARVVQNPRVNKKYKIKSARVNKNGRFYVLISQISIWSAHVQ